MRQAGGSHLGRTASGRQTCREPSCPWRPAPARQHRARPPRPGSPGRPRRRACPPPTAPGAPCTPGCGARWRLIRNHASPHAWHPSTPCKLKHAHLAQALEPKAAGCDWQCQCSLPSSSAIPSGLLPACHGERGLTCGRAVDHARKGEQALQLQHFLSHLGGFTAALWHQIFGFVTLCRAIT